MRLLRSVLQTVFWISFIGFVVSLPVYYRSFWPLLIGGDPAQPSSVDVLAFWGAVFGGVITLIGVIMTIRSSHKHIERMIRQQEISKFIDNFPNKISTINKLKFQLTLLRANAIEIRHQLANFLNTSASHSDIVRDVHYFYGKLDDLESAFATDAYLYHETLEVLTKLRITEEQFLDKFAEENYPEALLIANTVMITLPNELDLFLDNLGRYKDKLNNRFLIYAKEDGLNQ